MSRDIFEKVEILSEEVSAEFVPAAFCKNNRNCRDRRKDKPYSHNDSPARRINKGTGHPAHNRRAQIGNSVQRSGYHRNFSNVVEIHRNRTNYEHILSKGTGIGYGKGYYRNNYGKSSEKGKE